MTKRFLVALVVAVGLTGCGRDTGTDDATQAEATELRDVTITRNPYATFTATSGDQTLRDISSVRVTDEQGSDAVRQFLAAPVEEAGGTLCCDSCSLSGGVLVCTGCKAC